MQVVTHSTVAIFLGNTSHWMPVAPRGHGRVLVLACSSVRHA